MGLHITTTKWLPSQMNPIQILFPKEPFQYYPPITPMSPFSVQDIAFRNWICYVVSRLADAIVLHTRVYPKVTGLAAWSENCKWYSSLPLDLVV
jgi:hypothetical protein